MNKQFDNSNRGAIWKRDAKPDDEPGKRYPDFTGQLNCGGHDYWVSAWKRGEDDSRSSPALRFQVKQMDGQPAPGNRTPGAGPSQKSVKEDMDDEIPW